MLVITADVRERASGVPEMLQALGAHVDVRALTRGDYVLGPETVIERKTVEDLHVQCHFADTKWLAVASFTTSVPVLPQRPWQAGRVLMVTVDVHERTSGIPQMLETLGACVEVRALTFGDYILGPETVVERKTVADLHGSIASGRFWRQMGKVRRAGRWPHLVIEGESLFAGPIPAAGVRGICLAVADLGVTIIRSEDTTDTAAWLFRLAARRRDGAIRDRPVYAHRPRSAAASPQEAALAAAPDVSVVTARTVLRHFGSLNRIAEASIEDLKALPGVGIKRATAIAALIHDPWTAPNAL